MKLLTTFLLVYIQIGLLAQLEENQQKKCYESNKTISGKPSVVNDCQKIAGIIDCGDDLNLDEDSKLIFKNKELKPFTGTCQSCHWNGKLDRKINFVNGKENGVDSAYYPSGCLQVVRNHIQGIESGKWVYFFDSTAFTAWEMNYRNGRKHGQQIYFDKKGDTTRIEHYSDGILDGEKLVYGSTGSIEKITTYKKGLLDGPFIVYNLSGQVIQELNFVAGKKNGKLTYYYSDGVLMSVENWLLDKKSGEFITYFHDGKVQQKVAFLNGVLNGWMEEFWADGLMKRSARYQNGLLLEEHRYNEQGIETYTLGTPTSATTEDDALPIKNKKRN